MVELQKEWSQEKYWTVDWKECSSNLKCKEQRLWVIRVWIIDIDSEIYIIRIGGCNNKEKWYETRWYVNNCKGNKTRMLNKQEVRWQIGNRSKYDTALLWVNGGPFPTFHQPFWWQTSPLVCANTLEAVSKKNHLPQVNLSICFCNNASPRQPFSGVT